MAKTCNVKATVRGNAYILELGDFEVNGVKDCICIYNLKTKKWRLFSPPGKK